MKMETAESEHEIADWLAGLSLKESCIIPQRHRMDGASVFFAGKIFTFFAFRRRNFPISLYMKTALVLL